MGAENELATVSQQFDALKSDLAHWRQAVITGELDFECEREAYFKESLRAFATAPEPLSEAQEMLDSWQAPEWETLNPRVVQWDKEQSRHLRERLQTPRP